MAASLTRFEHDLLRHLRENHVLNLTLLVGTSGGADSMALLCALQHISPLLRSQVFAAHIHHGWINGIQGEYRDRAWKFVKHQCEQQDISFYSNLLELIPKKHFTKEPQQTLKSEAKLRDFRYEALREIAQKLETKTGNKTLLVLAHNANDLLETRLMRLVRGTGAEGAAAMQVLKGDILRPLLSVDRSELVAYLKEIKQDYINDPSNENIEPLRNWMRKEWLPQLEAKRPGAIINMARSLGHLLEEKSAESWNPEEVIQNRAIDHRRFLEFSREDQRRLLATYMRYIGLKSYGLSHIDEVIKRLDSPKKIHSFSLLKHNWTVNAEQIKASPL